MAARGFRTVGNFMAIAYLLVAKLKYLSVSPLALTVPFELGKAHHVC